ncbi:MAG TPA: hypothetical protein VNQ79_12510 [Blastocatellia bacterium]|nr:hypothetical protein [Blastocatellia bacterium]
MAAEPDITNDPQRNRYLSLVALYEREEDASELLDRLEALSIDTSEATIVHVDNRPPATAARATAASALSPLTRSILTAMIIGGALGFLIGVALYEGGLLGAAFSSGIFAAALAGTITGALFGLVFGSIAGAAAEKVKRRAAVPDSAPPTRHGFLVVVKVPLRLAEQAETIARRLGAKEIIL